MGFGIGNQIERVLPKSFLSPELFLPFLLKFRQGIQSDRIILQKIECHPDCAFRLNESQFAQRRFQVFPGFALCLVVWQFRKRPRVITAPRVRIRRVEQAVEIAGQSALSFDLLLVARQVHLADSLVKTAMKEVDQITAWLQIRTRLAEDWKQILGLLISADERLQFRFREATPGTGQ